MRAIVWAFFFSLVCFSGFAQETTLVLSKKQFSPNEQLAISSLNGWVFKQGNSPHWSNKNLNTADWQRLKPDDLTARQADSPAFMEGWFRLRVQLDSSLLYLSLGLVKGTWAAADVYLDGRLIHSYGNMGVDGKPFKEYNSAYDLPDPIQITFPEEHVLAIHLLQKKAYSEPNLLLLESKPLLSLTGAAYTSTVYKSARSNAVYTSIWLFVSFIIALLLWLLSSVNLYEKKIIYLIAIAKTLISIEMLTRFLLNFNLSFEERWVNLVVFNLAAWTSNGFTIIALAAVLLIPIPRNWSVGIVVVHALAGILNVFIFHGALINVYLFIQFFTFLGLTYVGWKNIKGASWALIVGVVLSSTSALLMALLDYTQKQYNYNLLFTVVRISFPLSFILYVALRMKELLIEIKEKAGKLIKAGEEKKQLLAEQNALLEQKVQQRTAELQASEKDLENTLNHLRDTQEELIRQEKLASVGQLTKGIVDRILNPLNYINNFSESSSLLVDELNELLSKNKNAVSEMIKEEFSGMLELIKSSVTKIYDNGATTTRIVKDMQKLLKEKSKDFIQTDLNAFVENHAKAAYQEIKANYAGLTGELMLELEKQPLEVKILPPEFGEVISALIDNSLYTLAEKSKSTKGFVPQIKITTEAMQEEIILKVKDNGKGIPPRDLERIFSPFFTTKPTSKGTGLGLFMSKDVIEIHKGKMEIHSKEGLSTEVVITLPRMSQLP
jgi:signal transduction histidine kinase